jgi:hypothetical protein
MACDKPTGDCTNVSPCGAGCSGCNGSTTPAPVLPKCQDVSLTPGTFTNATVTVNAQGCIAAIASGEPEVYTPDDCCGDSSGGGGGAAGARGPKGDPGAAATIAVQQAIGTGTTWSVENIGTSSAAIFKFTAPAASTGGGGTTSGYTGDVGGFVIEAGLVKSAPASIVESVEAKKEGTKANLFSFLAVPDLANLSEYDITLNLDAFYDSIDSKFTGLHNDQATLITNLTGQVATLTAQVAALAGQQPCIGLVSARQSGPITSNYIIEVSGVAPNSTLTLTGWNITSFTTDATGYGITQAQLAVTEGCGTISHPTCGLVVSGGSVAIACVNGSGGGGSTTADYWAFVSGSCQLNPAVSAGTTTYATQAACNAANPPADYWAYVSGSCQLNPFIVGGQTTYATQAACVAANSGGGSTDYWAYSVTLGICELNPTVVGGTPSYATQALCNAANGI